MKQRKGDRYTERVRDASSRDNVDRLDMDEKELGVGQLAIWNGEERPVRCRTTSKKRSVEHINEVPVTSDFPCADHLSCFPALAHGQHCNPQGWIPFLI